MLLKIPYLKVVKSLDCLLTLYNTVLTTLMKKALENIVGKGENACNKLSALSKTEITILSMFDICRCFAIHPKFCLLKS